jgi:hypothetical protein
LGDSDATITAIHAGADAIGYPDLAQDCIVALPAVEI